MSKAELIERIMHINHSARREFLEDFSQHELYDYLRQLESITRISLIVPPEPQAAVA